MNEATELMDSNEAWQARWGLTKEKLDSSLLLSDFSPLRVKSWVNYSGTIWKPTESQLFIYTFIYLHIYIFDPHSA